MKTASYILETIFRWDFVIEVPYNYVIRLQFLAPNAMNDNISKHRELYSREAKRKYEPHHHTENLN